MYIICNNFKLCSTASSVFVLHMHSLYAVVMPKHPDKHCVLIGKISEASVFCNIPKHSLVYQFLCSVILHIAITENSDIL